MSKPSDYFVTFQANYSLEDITIAANYGTPAYNLVQAVSDLSQGTLPSLSVAGTYATIPLNYEIQLSVVANNSDFDEVTARMEVMNVPQPSGPHDLENFTMTEYYTIYSSFGTITFTDVKVGTNTTQTKATSSYGGFDGERDITITRTLTKDIEGDITGLIVNIQVPVIDPVDSESDSGTDEEDGEEEDA